MSTQLIRLTADAYPFGCKGDIIPVNDKDIDELKKVAKRRKLESVFATIDQSNGHDEAEANDGGESDTPHINKLRARAKELNISAGGSAKDLQARIEEAEANPDA